MLVKRTELNPKGYPYSGLMFLMKINLLHKIERMMTMKKKMKNKIAHLIWKYLVYLEIYQNALTSQK